MCQQVIKRSLQVLIAWLTIFFCSCRTNSEPEVFLIPSNYEGVVIVLFSQLNGEQEKYLDNRRLYDIPQNGVLATRFTKTKHGELNQRFYYKDNNGNKKTELIPYSFGKADEQKNYIMNGVYGEFTSELDSFDSSKYRVQYRMFTVGKIKDKDRLQALSDSFLRKIIQSY